MRCEYCERSSRGTECESCGAPLVRHSAPDLVIRRPTPIQPLFLGMVSWLLSLALVLVSLYSFERYDASIRHLASKPLRGSQ